VITPVAASPFDFDERETIVAFADQAADFTQQTVSVYTISWLWTELARNSRRHWEDLASHDPARNDVRNVLSAVCQGTDTKGYRAWEAPPISNEPTPQTLTLPPCLAKAVASRRKSTCPPPRRASSSCFAKTNLTVDGAPFVLIAAAHSPQQVWPDFPHLYVAIWEGICSTCALKCTTRAEGAPYALGDSDVYVDMHWSLPLQQMDSERHKFVFYSWDPGKMGRFFHFSGNLLEMVGVMERIVAEVQLRPSMALHVKFNQEMRNTGGFIYSWRKLLGHFGMTKPAINKLVDKHISKFSANWTREISAHMAAFKAG